MAKDLVLFGIDKLLTQSPDWKHKKIGLLTNDGALTSTGVKSRIALIKKGFNIVRLFAPEHGISSKGKDGAFIPYQTDEITNLPVFSLYQEIQSVNDENIADLDVLLIDLPDVGVRFYTYLWTLTYFIESAARLNKKIYILDRPNPLGGNTFRSEGPAMSLECRSFVGRFDIPITHFCTLGELANYFNHINNWGAEITIVCCDWQRKQTFLNWKRPWVYPSPALVNFNAVLLYPGLCFLEATNIGVGRNSQDSFQWIGGKEFDLRSFEFHFPGISMSQKTLELKNVQIEGISFLAERDFFEPVKFGLSLLFELINAYTSSFKWEPYPTQANPSGENHLDLLLGVYSSTSIFELDRPSFQNKINRLLKTDWDEIIKPFLLYD